MDKAVQLSKSWDMWPIVEGKKKKKYIYIYIFQYIKMSNPIGKMKQTERRLERIELETAREKIARLKRIEIGTGRSLKILLIY